VLRRFNFLVDELDASQDRDGFSWNAARIGDKLGAEKIGSSLYELAQGQRTFPYHYHHGVEEWLYVLAGAPSLRTPEGEQTLRPGDLVCFNSGPRGAHVIAGPGRLIIFSANAAPSTVVYPDSDKLGTRPGSREDNLNFRRADAVDYWDGE
jgi:uncharacterized cupin superfamily protein